MTAGLTDFNCQLGDVLDGEGVPVPVSDESAHAFNTGLVIGKNIASAAWKSTDQDRMAVEGFVSAAVFRTSLAMGMGLGGLDPAYEEDQPLGCRAIGVVQGVAIAVAEILTETVVSCAADGDYWSTFAAGLFCEFSEISGGLDLVEEIHEVELDSVCAEAFEATCEARFIEEARAYTSDFVADCNPWVDNTHADIVECHKENLCTYRAL